METKKKISLMLVVILIMQIMLPMLTIMFESELTLFSRAEEGQNTWDISATNQDHVTATFDEETGLLTISGTGKMKNWIDLLYVPWCPKVKNIKQVTLKSGITNIGSNAFYDCTSLMQIEIPSSVTSIGNFAFYGCISLEQIEIPANVTSIGSWTVYNCSSLKKIEVNEYNTKYSSVEGVLYNKEKTTLICYPASKTETIYKIVDGVKTIGNNAFSGCTRLTQIEIPSSVTSIGYDAFYGCTSLEQIEIPEGVTNIESSAFEKCTSLMQIEIPSSVTSIGSSAFYGCTNLKQIEIPEGVTSIGSSTFCRCTSLTQIKIPSSVTSIGDYAFSECPNLTNIKVDDGNTEYSSIDGVLYNKDGTTLIYYPAGKTETIYKIIGGVTSIGWRAFDDCTSLKQIEIPLSVTSIGSDAFSGCTSLEQIEIPDEVTSIGNRAFSGCTSLISINVNENNQKYKSIDGVLFNKNGTKLVKYPEGKKETDYIIPKGVTSIGDYVFEGCTSLTRIEIPEGITWIQYTAFSSCKNLTIYTNNDYVVSYAIENDIAYVLDKDAPTVTKISDEINKCVGTNGTVTLTIEGATDGEGVGLAKKTYSFDNGETWQEENTKTFSENTENIVIKVRDKLGNEYTHEEINITNIREHEWNEGQITKVATCTEKGEKTYTCTVCGETKTEDIPALGHNEVIDKEVAATCTTAGKTEGKHCSRCNKVLVEQKDIPALGHNYENGVCIRCKEKEPEIVLESTNYEVVEKYITRIKAGTIVKEVKTNIQTNATVKVYNKENKEIGEKEKIATGMKIEFTLGNKKKTYPLVVTGDLNGDGQVGDIDLLRLARYKVGLDTTLMDEYLQAADLNGNKNLADDIDLLMMARALVGLYNL